MNVIVTGAGGAVGSYIVQQLHLEGHAITAIDLPYVPIQEGEGINPCPLDLCQLEYKEIKALVKNASAIIHTAAIVDIGKTREEIWPLNVEVTKNLACAASEEMFCKFIHISSGSIYAPSTKKIDEAYRLLPTSPYEESKIHSEAAVQVIGEHAAQDFSWTILRPALIYGPRARFLGATLAAIPSILRMLRLSKIGLKGGPITNWVHAEDVARAAVHCLTCEATDNRTFNIADDTPTPFGDTITDYITAYGITPLITLPLPSLLTLKLLKPAIDNDLTFRAINIPLKAAWKLFRELYNVSDCLSVKVDREASPYIFHNTVFDNSALKKTGFNLRWPNSKEGIYSAMNWYRQNNWIS